MLYVVLGAGGLGITVAGILEHMRMQSYVAYNRKDDVAFLDDKHIGKEVNGYKVLGGVADSFTKESDAYGENLFIVAFGTTFMDARMKLFERLKKSGKTFFNAIHPTVVIDRTAEIGEGIIMAAGSIVNPNAKISDNCVLCVAATVDHETIIGENVYLSPGVNIGGEVIVGKNALIGMNATILPEIKIGESSIVGAGAVVTKDVPPITTVVGNPARIIKRRK